MFKKNDVVVVTTKENRWVTRVLKDQEKYSVRVNHPSEDDFFEAPLESVEHLTDELAEEILDY